MAKKKSKKIKVSKKKMLKEHRHLVRILEKGSREKRKKEAKKQKEEMYEYE